MPQIVFKSLNPDQVRTLSSGLLEQLADISQTPHDYFRFELNQSRYFFKGQEVESYPLVEVIQFDRGKEVEGKMARTIQAAILALGYQECEVYFTHVTADNYYE